MQAEDDHDVLETSSTDDASRDETFRRDLFVAAWNCDTDDDYRDFKRRLLEPPLDPPAAQNDDGEDETSRLVAQYVTLLHVLLYTHGEIPLDIIEWILDKAGVDLASKKDVNGDTPLHILAINMPDRSDIARFLMEQSPQCVQERDEYLSRPIDLISQKFIMAEELIKYGADVDLEGMWATVHCLATASRPDIEFQQPLVHSCIVSPGFPIALLARAIKRYHDQLSEANDQGDLPLHLWASNTQQELDPDDGEEADVVETNLLSLILKTNVNAATALNNDGTSPLALAIQNGHGWNSSVVRTIISHAPASLETLNLPLSVFPYLHQRLVQEELWYPVFSLLRATPPEVTH